MDSRNVILFALITLIGFSVYRRKTGRTKVWVDIEEKDGAQIKTFYDAKGNIEVVVITDHDSSITAIPLKAMSRQRKMSDEEYQCLKKCKKPDGSYDTNCTLLCPVTKKYQLLAAM